MKPIQRNIFLLQVILYIYCTLFGAPLLADDMPRSSNSERILDSLLNFEESSPKRSDRIRSKGAPSCSVGRGV